MANMPMPTGLTLFVMAGSKAAELAGNIVNSVQDHVSEASSYAISCFALVDDAFEEEKAVVDNVFYRYDAQHPGQMAADIALQKVRSMIGTLAQKGIAHISLNRMNCVFVADANDAMTFDQLADITREIQRKADNISIRCDAFLCLLTDYQTPGTQNAWLMRDGSVHPDMKLFEKTLLLSNKDTHGGLGAHVEQKMRDAVAPALLLMLNGHELNDQTRLYTASYSKVGGTSNDIMELKRHIAAEVLDGFFANPNEAGDVWKFLSTSDMDLTIGHSALERAMSAAERSLPSLEIIAATADLEDKTFDPATQIQAFDRLNCKAMCEPGDLPERWLEEILEKVKDSYYLDALLLQLAEDGEICKSISKEWFDLHRNRKSLIDPERVASLLGGSSKKKGLFEQWRDHNLQMLNVAVAGYRQLCKERYAYRFLSCLQQKLPVLREKLQNLIDLRKVVLEQFKQPADKMAMLLDEKMCGRAAGILRAHFAKTSVLNLNTFLNSGEYLYQPEGAKHWRDLFREFLSTSKLTSSFADAFMEGKDHHGLQSSVEQLAQNVYPLIPDYPLVLGALPIPTNYYLLNENIADHLRDGESYAVYSVPGDVMEYLSLYRVSSDYQVLRDFKLFAPGMSIGTFASTRALQQRRFRSSTHTAEVTEQNTLGIRLKLVDAGVQVAWNFTDTKAVYDILVNDEVVEARYDFKTYTVDGMVFIIPKQYLHGSILRVGLRCGEEYSERVLELAHEHSYAEVKASKTKAKNGDIELVRCSAEYPDGLDNKCLVLSDGPQLFRLPLLLSDLYTIAPLWLPEGVGEVALEDID